jgi:hypothetical protein
MTRLKFDFDFSYEAATGQPWAEVVESLMHEAGALAVERLRALAPRRTGKLAADHRAIPGTMRVVVENVARYAEFVQPKGSTGRWRYWIRRELRNAFEDVSLARFGDVEDALLASIGPIPRAGERRDRLAARMAGRKAGTAQIAVPTRTQRPTRPRAARGAR